MWKVFTLSMKNEFVLDRNCSRGRITGTTKVELKAPFEGGNVDIRRSVLQGDETLIFESRRLAVSAAWMLVMAGTSTGHRVMSLVRVSDPTAMAVMLAMAAMAGRMVDVTHCVAAAGLSPRVRSSSFGTPTATEILSEVDDENACKIVGLVS